MTNGYENNLEHLLDELRRIHLIISFNRKFKSKQNVCTNDFQGLCVTDEEIDEILQEPPFEIWTEARFDRGFDTEFEKIHNLTVEINAKKSKSIEAGKELRLHKISELFHLDPFEVDALLICLAPELDLRYEKIYSYLQNDVTKKRPTVDLVKRLLYFTSVDGFEARKYFSPLSNLISNRLVYLTGEEGHVPLLSKSIKVDERIVSYLLGSDDMDSRIRNFSILIRPGKSCEDFIPADGDKKTLLDQIKQYSNLKKQLLLFFHGPYGTGKKMMAEVLCSKLGTSLLIIDSKMLLKDESFELLKIGLRETMLQNSCVYLEGFDALWKEKEAGVNVTNLMKELDIFPKWIFLSGEENWEPADVLERHGYMSIRFSIPPYSLRKMMWTKFLDGEVFEDADIDALAGKFKFSAGQIKDAIFTAKNSAATGGSKLSLDNLYEGCRAQSSRNLSAFARKIESHYTWKDIVLPPDIEKQLKEVSGYIQYKGKVYNDWEFGRKLTLGKGLNVLFTGPSGTGKTMSTEIIARDAGLDLYKIDLSVVVSKYIGETEKNLSRIFKEAETSNAILFFDEADALFGKRSEVKDAHDRYANIEIGYLLQKMEEYEGVVILATNLSKNIDDAFSRRMQFMIEFPFPDEVQRKLIWTGIFPEKAPLSKDIDYDFLSKRLKLAGGNIKNIAIAAAFLAAEESCEIGMRHIMHASKREYQKMGKTFLKTDFEQYYNLMEA